MIIRPAGIWTLDGQLLTMRYQYGGRDRFNLPGGNQEPGEEIRAGLVREFKEELGVVVTVGDLLLAAETAAGGREVLHLMFAINSLNDSPKLNPQETKALELVWLSAKKLQSAPLYPAVGPILSNFIGHKIPQKTYLGRVFQEWID